MKIQCIPKFIIRVLIKYFSCRFFAANALACAIAYILFKCCYGTPREDSVDAARAKKAAAAAAAASVNRDRFLYRAYRARLRDSCYFWYFGAQHISNTLQIHNGSAYFPMRVLVNLSSLLSLKSERRRRVLATSHGQFCNSEYRTRQKSGS